MGRNMGQMCMWILLTGCVTSIFVKEKLKMRAGETDKSVSGKRRKTVCPS